MYIHTYIDITSLSNITHYIYTVLIFQVDYKHKTMQYGQNSLRLGYIRLSVCIQTSTLLLIRYGPCPSITRTCRVVYMGGNMAS
jgi:hypothetical protein